MCIKKSRAGFILLEVMLAVGIFAVGVIALAECVNNCLTAQMVKNQSDRARLALENRMAQIEAGETDVAKEKTEKLKGAFEGMTMQQKRLELKLVNENKKALAGLYEVQLAVSWTAPDGEQNRELSFYVYRPQ